MSHHGEEIFTLAGGLLTVKEGVGTVLIQISITETVNGTATILASRVKLNGSGSPSVFTSYNSAQYDGIFLQMTLVVTEGDVINLTYMPTVGFTSSSGPAPYQHIPITIQVF
jgi:hypothetical protein